MTVLYRAFPVELRDLDEREREVTIIAATQAPVTTRAGAEALLMSGCDLTRFRGNPIILDSHNLTTVDAVLGSARSVDIRGGKLVLRARFARGSGPEPTLADRAWSLVRDGHLRGASCAYLVREARAVPAGSVDVETGAVGPAVVATRWELLEVSMTAVPTDPGAGVRAYRRALANAHRRDELAQRRAAEHAARVAAERARIAQMSVADLRGIFGA